MSKICQVFKVAFTAIATITTLINDTNPSIIFKIIIAPNFSSNSFQREIGVESIKSNNPLFSSLAIVSLPKKHVKS